MFEALGEVVPDDAVIAVDVGNNTYSFGHFFECRGRQDVLMSGLPRLDRLRPAGGASARRSPCDAAGYAGRKVVSISGDGGLGQYLAEVTTAVKYGFPLTHVVLDNGELAKISREQLGAIRPVWETEPRQPRLRRVRRALRRAGLLASRTADELRPALEAALRRHRRPVPRGHRHQQPRRLNVQLPTGPDPVKAGHDADTAGNASEHNGNRVTNCLADAAGGRHVRCRRPARSSPSTMNASTVPAGSPVAASML